MANPVQLGLKENWKQFALLVTVNGFVGGMIGLERTILPKLAESQFHITNTLYVVSFIIVFGVSKAVTNYFTGALADKYGRKNLLIAGWLLALPLPLILMYADHWNLILMSNVLLGIHQGLAWSSTVVMKIDLVGSKQRGLAMGINEFAGYVAVAGVAFGTGFIADRYGIRPYPFLLGMAMAVIGLLLSWIWVRDTRHFVNKESGHSTTPRLKHIFRDTSWKHPQLGSITQAGLINNLNDGMAWGLFPILLSNKGFSLTEIGIITATYPAVWGFGQLITGKMSDLYCKKDLLFLGMMLQALALFLFARLDDFKALLLMSALLGWGTAMVYPTFLAGIAENTHPADRAKSLGVFRFWRDLGYAIGAIITGLIAQWLGIAAAILMVAILTLVSALIIYVRMKCKPKPHTTPYSLNTSSFQIL
ncbi:MAG: MFS transporter [Chitinophagaceae bacterium]